MNPSSLCRMQLGLAMILVGGVTLGQVRAENWPRFRGENGSGLSRRNPVAAVETRTVEHRIRLRRNTHLTKVFRYAFEARLGCSRLARRGRVSPSECLGELFRDKVVTVFVE